MTDLFEYINGVKLNSKKIIEKFDNTLVLYFITSKNLKNSNTFINKTRDIATNILETDTKDHIIIVFDNSQLTETYSGFIFVYDKDQKEFHKHNLSEPLQLQTQEIHLIKNGRPIFLEMFLCWGISFKTDDEDINMLSFKCIGKNKQEIKNDCEIQIEKIYKKYKETKTREEIVNKLYNISKELDFYELSKVYNDCFKEDNFNLTHLYSLFKEAFPIVLKILD